MKGGIWNSCPISVGHGLPAWDLERVRCVPGFRALPRSASQFSAGISGQTTAPGNTVIRFIVLTHMGLEIGVRMETVVIS